MVWQGEQPTKKTAEEFAQETKEEITWAGRLAWEVTGKIHNGRQDD
jgi:hypothetical protein